MNDAKRLVNSLLAMSNSSMPYRSVRIGLDLRDVHKEFKRLHTAGVPGFADATGRDHFWYQVNRGSI